MSQYILLNRIRVQNANAIAGFTWGFPAITNFLGFTHNLSRKLSQSDKYSSIRLSGCAVIAHEHHVHTYGKYGDRFTQVKSSYISTPEFKKGVMKTPSIIEEGKMNMTVSLLIEVEGRVGNATWVEQLVAWIEKQSLIQRLAGGTILDIADVKLVDTQEKRDRYALKSKLLPGFVLMDRSSSLGKHYQSLQQESPNAELLDAWLDFSAFKQQARPKYDQISKYLEKGFKQDEAAYASLLQDWQKHLERVPYQQDSITDLLKEHFSKLDAKKYKTLLAQWRQYLEPNEKTPADWERLPKPEAKGFLVPIMIGYKAITPVYDNAEISNTRDSETPVCFVEAVHSIGEWKSAHRLRTEADFLESIWRYNYQEHWYLCKQDTAHEVNGELNETTTKEAVTTTDDDYDDN
jgi:CRISPR-associated protein Csy2